jgi:hypothetical protein
MKYAYVQNDKVFEIIEPFFRVEADRPAAPAVRAEDAAPLTEMEQALFDEQRLTHDSFVAGEVPIAQRFHADFLASMVPIPEGVQVNPGDGWDGSIFSPAPPAPERSAADVLAQRDALLAFATLRIAPLQDAVDLDESTADETAALKAWKQYRVALSRIETDQGFPASVDWPKAPA